MATHLYDKISISLGNIRLGDIALDLRFLIKKITCFWLLNVLNKKVFYSNDSQKVDTSYFLRVVFLSVKKWIFLYHIMIPCDL